MWCPKCKIEYQDGISVCADCGTQLEDGTEDDFDVIELCKFNDVDIANELMEFLKYSGVLKARVSESDDGLFIVFVPAKDEKKAYRLFRGFVMSKEESRDDGQSDNLVLDTETDDSLEEDNVSEDDKTEKNENGEGSFSISDIGEIPDEMLYEQSNRYVKKEEAYKDMKFTGWSFIIVGAVGLLYLLLCQTNVIPINYNIIVLFILVIMFAAFVISGISSVIKSGRMKRDIPEEEIMTEEINAWLSENVTEEIITGWKDENVSDAENDINLMNKIRYVLIRKYPEQDKAFLDMLAEEYFRKNFVEE